MASLFRFFARQNPVAAPSTESSNGLFPEPAHHPPSRLSPAKLPGRTPESTQTLLRLLHHNKEHYHIFFNDLQFHNHVTHHILAEYALGASSDLLIAAYKVSEKIQKAAFPSPGKITHDNYADHIGEEKWYQAYFNFFADELLSNGVSKTIDVYVFSKKANYEDDAEREGRKQKAMFSRFIGGLFHPLIHLGYGVEFGIPYMVTEALAQTAISDNRMESLIPRSRWDEQTQLSAVNSLVSRMSALVLNTPPQKGSPIGEGDVSVFNVIALIQKDASFSNQSLQLDPSVDTYYFLVNGRGKDILKYADMWTLNITESSDAEALDHKIEELAFAVAILYGIGGWKNGKVQPFQADFNLMHLVTSSVFLPSICAYLSPQGIQLLLRTYFASILTVWISRGRPPIRITEDFLSSVSSFPQEPKASTRPAKDTLVPEVTSPNPWLAITQSSLVHPEDHIPKVQRALLHWSSLFGTTPAGKWATGNDRLEGIELLDGSIFVRAAGLTADSMGWMREGQKKGEWSHALFEG